MQHLLRSIYNNRWFPFQTIPLSSSPRPSPSLLVPSESPAPIPRTTQDTNTHPDQGHPFHHDASQPRSLATQFHLLQITSTSLSISVSLSPSFLSNQIFHPIIRLNSQPWYKFHLLGQTQINNTHQVHASIYHSSHPKRFILIYGLEPGTVYDVDLELTLLDQHSPLDLTSNFTLRSCDQLDDNDQHDIAQELNPPPTVGSELNEPPLARRQCQHLKLTDASAIDLDGPPPPYTSYDPASPTQTCTSDVIGSSSHSFSPLESSFSDVSSPETSVEASAVPPSRSGNPNEDENVLRIELDKQALALRAAIEENAPLKQHLEDLEKLIKRLDEENMHKSDELLVYGEPNLEQLAKRIEGQNEELRRKTEEYQVLEHKNEQKLNHLKQNNHVLKTRWEDSVQSVGDFKEKTLKPLEEEIEDLTRQLCECDKEIKAIDRETHKRAMEHSNQFQVVRSRTSSKKNNAIPPASHSAGPPDESSHDQASKNNRKSKWRSMDDFKFTNLSPGRRTHSPHNSTKRVPVDDTVDHPNRNSMKSGVRSGTLVAQEQLHKPNRHHRSGLNKSVSFVAGSPAHLSPEKRMQHLRGQSASTHHVTRPSSATGSTTPPPTSSGLAAAPSTTTTTNQKTARPVTYSFPASSSSSAGTQTWAEKLAQS